MTCRPASPGIRLLLAALLAVLAAGPVLAQAPARPAAKPATGRPGGAAMQTRPERTSYQETSSYDDVVSYMKAMAAASPQIHLTTYGYTYEGRPMPLAVIGAPDATPEAVLKTRKLRVYIQGDIHAGEVEGKEAALWLLRSIAKGERAEWLKSVVLLVNPIYNADGNEKVNLRNRGRQNGPVGGMGQRANGQNLDLNRDCTKLESSEARSLAMLMTRYDPHVAIDLHTTDGSPHGFYLTYQTSVSPNTSAGLIDLARNQLFPFVTKTVKAKHGWDFFYYGNLSRQGERAWYNDAELYKPRYTQTYFGIRNRLGILVETFSYATFEDRIKADYWFLEETLNFAVKQSAAIQKATSAADAESIVGKPQSVRGKLVKEAEPVQVVLADSVDERNPYVPDRPDAAPRERQRKGRGDAALRAGGADRDQPRAARLHSSKRPGAATRGPRAAFSGGPAFAACGSSEAGRSSSRYGRWLRTGRRIRTSLGERARSPRGPRREVLPHVAGDDGQGRALPHRIEHGRDAGVPEPQDAHGHRQMGDVRGDSPGRVDRDPDGPAARAPRVPALRPAVGRRVHDMEPARREPGPHAGARVLPRAEDNGDGGETVGSRQ